MYKIIIDSCGELNEKMKQDSHFANVPLTLDNSIGTSAKGNVSTARFP